MQAHSAAARVPPPAHQVVENHILHDNSPEDDPCDQTLLSLVARGSAIITELFRLIELVPPPFKYDANRDPKRTFFLSDDKRFSLDDLICDFSYFNNSEAFEARIEASDLLKREDEEFCDTFIDILTRFYLTFDSIHRYASDLKNFLIELEDDVFVGTNLDILLDNIESSQLLCEAHFQLGYMLMVTDSNFEGGLRERLIVSYYRYSSYKSSPDSNFDNTCSLMRSSGFRTIQQQIYRSSSPVQYYRPKGYPEDYFGRIGINQSIVNLLLAKLQSTDIYNQTTVAFPHPDHRSAALSQQASMCYVILYFCPNILNSQRSRMREITDKFFYDNWIISVYMGEVVNLIEAWQPYKAARESLLQLLDSESTKSLINQNNVRFCRVSKQIQDFLREGWMNDNTVSENHSKILNQIREGNVILKWMLLHTQTDACWQEKLSTSSYDDAINCLPTREVLYKFLKDISVLERRFSTICDKLLIEKDCKINAHLAKSIETLEDLVSIFSEQKPARWVQTGANSKFADVLGVIASKLKAIDISQSRSRDSLVKLIGEIDSSRDSYSDGKSLQVAQMFAQAKEFLMKALKLLGLSSDIKIALQSICDFSYAWRLMDGTFTQHMQKIIKDNPLEVSGFKSTFLKLASASDSCLMRIQQVNSHEDLVSVSQYYSTKLVLYIRDVLQIIPENILELVSSIIAIQTGNVIGDMPAKIPLDNLKDYALPEKRFQMLEYTYKISHYAETMLMIQDTTIGLIRINSKQLLEDGIRRELVKRMSDSIQDLLQFPETTQSPNSELQTVAEGLLGKLKRLDTVMSGYKRSFEFIQDYLFIYGLRMWQEELSRIIKFNVELATQALSILNSHHGSQFNHHRCYESPLDYQQSLYQSTKAPIPTYGPSSLQSSFVLRILKELLKITDPRSTIYDEQMSAWYEQKPQRAKIVDLKVFELIASSLTTTGLNGLDQMCCSLLTIELQTLDTHIMSTLSDNSLASQNLVDSLKSIGNLGEQLDVLQRNKQQVGRIFATASARMAPRGEKIVNHLLHIGQLQAIRNCIGCVMSTRCRYEARNLYNCLETLNDTLMATLKHGKEVSQQKAANFTSTLGDNEDSSAANHLAPSTSEEELSNSNGLEESQLIFELTNHLDWIGLSDPLSKVYTLALQASDYSQIFQSREQLPACEMLFLVLLDQCSKFHFSRSISGFLPKQTRSFYETSCIVDSQPLFYGLVTLLNHYRPFLATDRTSASLTDSLAPARRLLKTMSLYVRCSLVDHQQSQVDCAIKPQDLTLEVANMILSMIELLRLFRFPSDELLAGSYLPKFVADTFQFTVCQLNSNR